MTGDHFGASGYHHHRGIPFPLPAKHERGGLGRGAPSIGLARLIGTPSPFPSPHSSVVRRGKSTSGMVVGSKMPPSTTARMAAATLTTYAASPPPFQDISRPARLLARPGVSS